MNKIVAYYSASGVTAKKAGELAAEIGADVHEIAPAEIYTSADLDWTNKKSRSTLEMKDPVSMLRSRISRRSTLVWTSVEASFLTAV